MITAVDVEPIKIDGSYGEGGGQILRTSVTLSAITNRPIEITNIRAKRSNPGLRPQHVNAVKAVASLCDAELENVQVGSSTIRFVPKEMRNDSIHFDVGTAGSITLILQTIIPAVSLSKKRVEVELVGGTDVKWSPTTDYLRFVVKEAFSLININFELEVKRRGYYPKGGGIVLAKIEQCERATTMDLLQAPILEPTVVSVCASLPAHVAQRQVAASLARLEKESINCNSYSASVEQSNSPGSSILVYSASNLGPFMGGDAVGEKGKRAEAVGMDATEKFLSSFGSGATVDDFLGDMLVLPLSLADGRSRYIVKNATEHLKTNLHVTSKILGSKYEISDTSDANYLVTIEGKPWA